MLVDPSLPKYSRIFSLASISLLSGEKFSNPDSCTGAPRLPKKPDSTTTKTKTITGYLVDKLDKPLSKNFN